METADSLPLKPAKATVLYFRFLVLYFLLEGKFPRLSFFGITETNSNDHDYSIKVNY